MNNNTDVLNQYFGFTMNHYIVVFISVLLLYSFYVTRKYKKDIEQYYDDLGKYRKNLYLLTVLLMVIGGALGYFYPDNWKVFVPLAGLSIILDLSIFQTPNILKIGNAEFKQEDLMKNQMASYRKAQLLYQTKADTLSKVIANASDFFHHQPDIPEDDQTQYIDTLLSLLKQYSDDYKFELSYYVIEGPITEEKLSEIVFRSAVATGTEFTNESKDVLVKNLSLQMVNSFQIKYC